MGRRSRPRRPIVDAVRRWSRSAQFGERLRNHLPTRCRAWLIRRRLDQDAPIGPGDLRFRSARSVPDGPRPLPQARPVELAVAPAGASLRSQVCRERELLASYHRYWASAMGESIRLHRKQWEHTFIAQALWERGALRPGATGVGFGVGEEPLVALFASRGCRVIATDLPADHPDRARWSVNREYARSLAELNRREVCPPAAFAERVTLREIDMNDADYGITGADFCWSACALEHLGSLEAGAAFVERSLRVLAPGGTAVHTTEFNLSSNTGTLTKGPTVLYRRRDLERLAATLSAAGHHVEALDLDPGRGPTDQTVDLPPYAGTPHTRTAVGDYLCTSVGLIITCGG